MRKDAAKLRFNNHRSVRTESVQLKDTAEISKRKDTAEDKKSDNKCDNMRHEKDSKGKMSYNQLNCYYTNL